MHDASRDTRSSGRNGSARWLKCEQRLLQRVKFPLHQRLYSSISSEIEFSNVVVITGDIRV